MSANAPTPRGFSKEEPIPGYRIKERLGVGGCGEVWKVNAPGGLVKAIKFVFGSTDEQLASRELRALNRIKEVRHPFLLTMERIEVVEGNLVIVTELADGSLKQRFVRQRERGLPGIPREELLAYLLDAADALDYIYKNYSLQHLDIKPENLLLVGNRVKLADFGLIKNLYERNVSLIEGLTPIYAPPELFEGKPNRHSDQYSVAIVYQHMLTGATPFDGTTAARLAAQHLHCAPDLAALPKADQLVVARALSKDPDKRYEDCRALINALVEAGRTSRREPPLAVHRAEGADGCGPSDSAHLPAAEPPRAEMIPATAIKDAGTEIIKNMVFDRQPSISPPRARPVVSAPSFDASKLAQDYVPTLFVGIGGTASTVLRKLRERLCSHLGRMDDLPGLRLLALDTDETSLNPSREETPSALHWRETLPLPLRRTEYYRDQAPQLLQWLSRRWLYNIPRDLRTGGLRPLGRLALVDHLDRVRSCLQSMLEEMTTPESIARTSATSHLNFRQSSPRVFIIASISGGTGGGMVTDMAYITRMLLAELGMADDAVHGVLMHSTPRLAAARDMALASAYSTLSELGHFSRPGSHYPGDPRLGLSAFHGNNRAFASCYFVHLGHELTDSQWESATDPVAEYLHCSSVTPAAQFLDYCRQADLSDSGGSEFKLRTFGLAQLGGSNTDIPVRFGRLLCEELVQRWRNGGRAQLVEQPKVKFAHVPTAISSVQKRQDKSQYRTVDRLAAEEVHTLGLELDLIEAETRDILVQEIGGEAEPYFARLIAQALEAEFAKSASPDGQMVGVLNVLETILGGDGSNLSDVADSSAFDSLQSILATRLQVRATRLGSALRDWLFDLVEHSVARCDGATHAAEWFQNHLRRLQGSAAGRLAELTDRTTALRDSLLADACHDGAAGPGKTPARPSQKKAKELQSCLEQYAKVRIERIVLLCAVNCVGTIEVQVTAALDRLQSFLSDLHRLADAFHDATPLVLGNPSGADSLDAHRRGLYDALMEQKDRLLVTLDKLVGKFLSTSSRRLPQLLAQASDVRSELMAPLQAASRAVVMKTLQEANQARISNQSYARPGLGVSDVQRCLDSATPPKLAESSESHLLLVAPQLSDTATIEGQILQNAGQSPTILRSTGGDVVICYEVEKLSIAEVAENLIGHRQGYAEAASRLRTRIDVKWQPLSAPMLAGN